MTEPSENPIEPLLSLSPPTLRPPQPGTRSQLINIPSSVYHGVVGKPLVVLVETHFSLGEAEIQGTWSHASPSGVRSTLVTFNKDSLITDMSYRERLVFREPNVSLTIRALRPDDEGDYQLKLNIEFHNNTGKVVREERTVQVTVDGEPPTNGYKDRHRDSSKVQFKGSPSDSVSRACQ